MRLTIGTRCPYCAQTVTAAPSPLAPAGHSGAVSAEGVTHPERSRPAPIAAGATPLAPAAPPVVGVAARREAAVGVVAGSSAPTTQIANPAPQTVTSAPSSGSDTITPYRHTGAGLALAARSTDPHTAHDAAAAVTDVQRRQVYRAVLEALYEHGPSTDHDLARYVSGKLGHPIGQTSVGKRRGELRDAGLVADSGHKGRTPTGATAIRWGLTTQGIHALEVAA